jgi:TonB-dependent receptor
MFSLHRTPFVLSLLALATSQACGQTAAPSGQTADTPTDTVVVSGRAASLKKSLAEKRGQRVVSDGVSADEIGAIPDFGLGEALERVPGVSMVVNNGRGESQFMTTRGFNPDYNAVTIDGIALPSTETTRRIVSLDVIPSSLASEVNVYKSFTPEMEGNAIGGLTNLRTRSALDRRGLHAAVRGDMADWTSKPRLRSNSPSGELEATVSNTFGKDDNFGVVLSGSFFSRTSSSLNTAVDSYSYFANAGTQATGSKLNPAKVDVSSALAMPDRLRWLSYDNVRERKSLFAKLDYDNNTNLRAHLGAGWFQHLNDENRHAHWLQNTTTATSPVTVADGSGSAASGQSQADYAKYDQNRQLSYVEAGAQYEPWARGVLDVALNQSHGSYRQDALLYTFAQANSAGLAYDYTQAPGAVPVMVPRNNSQLFDATRYTLSGTNGSQLERSDTNQTTLKIDFSHNLDATAKGWGVKGGLQQRNADKTYNYDESLFNTASGQTVTLAQMGVNPSVYVPYTSLAGRPMLFVDQTAASAYVAGNAALFTPAANNTFNSTTRDFEVREDLSAAYAMGAYQSTALTALFGLRAERMATTIDTWLPSPITQAAVFAPYHGTATRTDLLPSVNLTWAPQRSLQVRAAVGESLARPQYSQLAQNANAVSGTTVNTTLANPGLNPRRSRNLDTSIEWYPNPNLAITAGLFDKRISDEIANTTSTSNFTVGSQTYTQNTTQATNVGTATVRGIELGFTQIRFTELPGLLSDFGLSANLTLMDQSAASVRMADNSLRQMPGLQESAKQIANVSLLWGTGPWSGQVAYKRTGRTLLTVSTASAAQDVYIATTAIVDAQLRYALNKDLSVTVQAKNLTDQAQQRRLTGPNGNLFNQEIYNGRSYWVGMAWAY